MKRRLGLRGLWTIKGQMALEYAVLVAAALTAVVLMSRYTQKAFGAHVNQIEEERNPTPPPGPTP